MGGVERGDPVRVGCVRANSASAALCGNDFAGVHLPIGPKSLHFSEDWTGESWKQ